MINKKRLVTSYKFYWGESSNFKGITSIQALCTLIMKRSGAPQQNLYATLAPIAKMITRV